MISGQRLWCLGWNELLRGRSWTEYL